MRKRAKGVRFERSNQPSLRSWREPLSEHEVKVMRKNVALDCGWGRVVFAHTFDDNAVLAETLRNEKPGKRDIALYLRDPHVVLSQAPQELFLDPSHTFRLWFSNYRQQRRHPQGFLIRRLRKAEDGQAINGIYASHGMVPVDPAFIWDNRGSRTLTYLVAQDRKTGQVIGTATGIDHASAFGDPENGASLWCLAVDPQCPHPGVGLALVHALAGHFLARGRAFMDLSVMHDNREAIALYEKLGFQRVPVFCLKHKNAINEPLFVGPPVAGDLNPYATIIVNEARRRGIAVEVLDAQEGYFALSFGGRTILCRESLSELTNAVAMSRCDDKAVTRRVLARAGLTVPRQCEAGDAAHNAAFLAEVGAVVVKPARGEQGQGISVNLTDAEDVERAVAAARVISPRVLLEQFCPGEDLRIVVIDHRVVAAAVRRPPTVVGTGQHSVRALIDKLSRRRMAATGGESRIPDDEETARCVREAGYTLDSVLPEGTSLVARSTANLHTGGSIHDVTWRLHPKLRDAAERASKALQIPVVGLDFMVRAVDAPDYAIIEANERPGLANHEPQPTAERFVDLLFPQTR